MHRLKHEVWRIAGPLKIALLKFRFHELAAHPILQLMNSTLDFLERFNVENFVRSSCCAATELKFPFFLWLISTLEVHDFLDIFSENIRNNNKFQASLLCSHWTPMIPRCRRTTSSTFSRQAKHLSIYPISCFLLSKKSQLPICYVITPPKSVCFF